MAKLACLGRQPDGKNEVDVDACRGQMLGAGLRLVLARPIVSEKLVTDDWSCKQDIAFNGA